MSTQTDKIPGTPTRDFTDAGTETSYTKGKTAQFEAGVHANFLAAGLIAVPEAETKTPAKPGA